MIKPRSVIRIFAPAALVLAASAASSQGFPNKPIRTVTNEVGGGADIIARLLAQELSGNLGQQVIVDNRGGGAIPQEIVSKAPPDGYTLLVNANNIWVVPLLQDNVRYDPVRDFSPVSLTNIAPTILVVHPSVAASSVKELIALAKARPGQLNYASGATGSAPHIAAELFKSMAGVQMTRVPYKSTGPALTGVVSGEVQLMFPNAAAGMPHVNSGRLKALAVASAKPSALAPGLPTVAASGLPGFESGSIYGVFAPAKTPSPIVDRLNQEIVRVLNKTEVQQKFFNSGVDVVGSSPAELAHTVKSEIARIGKVIKEAGIRAE